MSDQLIPRAPKHKKQPTAEQLRHQLALAADEIIRLRIAHEWYTRYSREPGPWPGAVLLVNGEPHPDAKWDPETGLVTFPGELPARQPWWRRIFSRTNRSRSQQ